MRVQGQSAAILVAIAFASVPGCSEDAITGPPTIRLGRDECAECGMLISEERSSSATLALVDGRREYLMFDDIGCMLEVERSPEEGRELLDRFVHDYGSQQWTSAISSWYVVASPDRLATPMGSGIAAFAEQASAEVAMREYAGKVVSWEDLQSLHLTRHQSRRNRRRQRRLRTPTNHGDS